MWTSSLTDLSYSKSYWNVRLASENYTLRPAQRCIIQWMKYVGTDLGTLDEMPPRYHRRMGPVHWGGGGGVHAQFWSVFPNHESHSRKYFDKQKKKKRRRKKNHPNLWPVFPPEYSPNCYIGNVLGALCPPPPPSPLSSSHTPMHFANFYQRALVEPLYFPPMCVGSISRASAS